MIHQFPTSLLFVVNLVTFSLSMKTSVMDKIRILRSSRRKTDPKQGRAPKPTPVVAPSQTPKPASSETTQQWVPVLVLDISQASTSPVTTTIPVAYNTDSVQSVTLKNNILVDKSLPVTTVTTCSGDVPVSHNNIILRCSNTDPKQSPIVSTEPVVDPASQGPPHVADTEPSELSEKVDHDVSDSQVRCVLCDKSFPSLKDMQTHYLSTHKSRRGKDSRKAKACSDNSATQAEVDGEQSGPDQSEPSLPIGDKGEVDPKCPVCSLDFTTADEVKKHMKEVHSYVCSECNSTFYSLFQFTNHKCTKVPKKVKRVRKKGGAGVATKLPLKPEVAKIMNRFVQIQPKTKKNNKVLLRKAQKSPTPPSVERVQQPFSMIALVNEPKQTHALENTDEKRVPPCSMTAPTTPEIAEEPPLLEAVTEGKRDGCEEEESTFLPSIEMAYSLKDSIDCKSEVQNCSLQIPVIETRNLEQARKQYLRTEESPELKVPKGELVMQKIAQLKRNPHVSLSWRPTLQTRRQIEESEEYVCGRCNVLCDDMEDYMDHLQDCLTMTSVTLEPASTPPQRLLKLPYQTASYGSCESGHNRYLINQSLMAKLKAYLPTPITPNSHPSSHHFKPPSTVPPASSGHTFRDLLDDDFGYESHESVDMQTAGSASPVSPATRNSETTHSTAVQGRACVSSTTRGTAQPMVMIPMDSKINLSVASDHQPLKKLSGHALGGDEATETYNSPGLAASPLGLLLDQDDIKMEVEEEVVEDHFEVR